MKARWWAVVSRSGQGPRLRIRSVSAVQVRPLLERLVEQDKAFGVLVKPSKKSAAQKLQCVAAGL